MDDSWREVEASWLGGNAFTGRNPKGVALQIGDCGGDLGIGPMELLLLGMAGCTGMDIVSILDKKRQPLQEFKVRVRGKRADEPPRVYTDIEVTYQLWGEGLDPKAVEHAIKLSEEKYCSASIMLGAVAKISSTYRLFAPGE